MPALEDLCQQYLVQFRQAQELARVVAAPSADPQSLLAQITDTAHSVFLLRASNDKLLDQIVLKRTAADLTADDIPVLQQFAAGLAQFSRRLDTGIAYYVHKLLYDYACLHNDTDLCVRELYEQGVALYYCNLHQPDLGINTVGRRVSSLFEAGAAYLPQFETLTDPKTRDYIIRCLGNRRMGMERLIGPNDHVGGFSFGAHYKEYRALFEDTMRVMESPHYRALAPDLPWDHYIYTLHYGLSRYVTSLREFDDPDMRREVLASAEYIYRQQERVANDTTGRFIPVMTRQRYALARYYNGLLDDDGLMQELLSMRSAAGPDDYTFEGQRVNLFLPAAAALHLSQMPAWVQERYRAAVTAWQDDGNRYLSHAPQNQYSNALDTLMSLTLEYQMSFDPSLQGRMMDLLLVRHPPTYVHSRVVAELCVWLFDRMVDTCPEKLTGLFGVGDASAIRADRRTLADEVYSCGLYHDIGKNMLLQVIGLYGRRLLDEEFALIQCHPLYSWYILRHHPHMENEAMAALYHHIDCDGQHGYPFNIPPLPDGLRPMVDILVTADTLDAATDNVGRSYAQAKTLDTLLGELRAGRGTRYPARVVDLFDDADFCAATAALLNKRRADLYVEIYSAQAPAEA